MPFRRSCILFLASTSGTKKLCSLTTTTVLRPFVRDYPGESVLSWSRHDGVTVASAEPYASYLHFTPEDTHTSTSPVRFLRAGCPSWHTTNSVKALKAQEVMLTSLKKIGSGFSKPIFAPSIQWTLVSGKTVHCFTCPDYLVLSCLKMHILPYNLCITDRNCFYRFILALVSHIPHCCNL